LFVGLCFGLAPYIFHLTYLERGYSAVGGEIFIFAVPALIWVIKDTLKDVARNDAHGLSSVGDYDCRNTHNNSAHKRAVVKIEPVSTSKQVIGGYRK